MNNSNIIMYTTEDGRTKIEVTFDEDTVWLSLDQLAELFQRDKSTISRHIKISLQKANSSKMQLLQNLQQFKWKPVKQHFIESIRELEALE